MFITMHRIESVYDCVRVVTDGLVASLTAFVQVLYIDFVYLLNVVMFWSVERHDVITAIVCFNLFTVHELLSGQVGKNRCKMARVSFGR